MKVCHDERAAVKVLIVKMGSPPRTDNDDTLPGPSLFQTRIVHYPDIDIVVALHGF
jgi:hypothetical protein